MQATAPGRSVVLQAGQTVVVEIAEGRRVSLLESALGTALTFSPVAELAATTAGSKTGFLATANSFRHAGQRTCFPAALSGIRIVLLQWGHRLICGIATPASSQSSLRFTLGGSYRSGFPSGPERQPPIESQRFVESDAFALSPNISTLPPTRIRSPACSFVDCVTRRLLRKVPPSLPASAKK